MFVRINSLQLDKAASKDWVERFNLKSGLMFNPGYDLVSDDYCLEINKKGRAISGPAFCIGPLNLDLFHKFSLKPCKTDET